MSDTPQQAQPAQAQPAQPAQQVETVAGVGFLVIAFTDETIGDQALDAMKQAKKQKQFYFEDAAVIRQDAKGKVHYHETGEMSVGKTVGVGALVGGVLGILGGPAGVALGAGIGAAIGAGVAGSDTGFKNESLSTVGVELKPGTSAVVAITSHDFLRAVQQNVPIDQIRTVVRNLSAEISARLGEGKDVAIGLLLTEAGLAIKEIAADAVSTEVVGAVITGDTAVVGMGVATADGVAYKVAAATDQGAAAEAGVITDDGAVIVDAVALPDDSGATGDANANTAPADAGATSAPAA